MKFRALDFDYDAEAAAIAANQSDSIDSTVVIIIPCGVYERDRLWKQRDLRNHKGLKNEQEDVPRKMRKQMDNQAASSINNESLASFPMLRIKDQESYGSTADESFHSTKIVFALRERNHNELCFHKDILMSLHTQASTLRLTSVPWHDNLRILTRPKEEPKAKLYVSPQLQQQLPSISYRIGPSHSESVFHSLGHRLQVTVASLAPPSIAFSWLALMRGDHTFGNSKVHIRKKQPIETAIVPYVPSLGVHDCLTLAVRIVMAVMKSQIATNAGVMTSSPQAATHIIPNDHSNHPERTEHIRVHEPVDEPWLESNQDFVFSPVKPRRMDRQSDGDARAKKKAKKEKKKKKRQRETKGDQRNNPDKNARESKKQRKSNNADDSNETRMNMACPQDDKTYIKPVIISDRMGTVAGKKGPRDIAKGADQNPSGNNRSVTESRKPPRWVEGLCSADDAVRTQSNNIEWQSMTQKRIDNRGQKGGKYGNLRLQHSQANSFVAKPVCEDRHDVAACSTKAVSRTQGQETLHDLCVNQSKKRSIIDGEMSTSHPRLTGSSRQDARNVGVASNIQKPSSKEPNSGMKHTLASSREETLNENQTGCCMSFLKGNLTGCVPSSNSGIASVSERTERDSNVFIRSINHIANENKGGVKRSGLALSSKTVYPRNSSDVNQCKPFDDGNSAPCEFHISGKVIKTQPTFFQSQALEQSQIASFKQDQQLQPSNRGHATKEPIASSEHCNHNNDILVRMDIDVKPPSKNRPSMVRDEKQNGQLFHARWPKSNINTYKESNLETSRPNAESSILFNSFRKRAGVFQSGKPQGPTQYNATADSMPNSSTDNKQATYYKWAVTRPDTTETPRTPNFQPHDSDGLSQREFTTGQSEVISTVRCLCSESFLEANAEIVVDLAAGTWGRATEKSSCNQMIGLVDTPLLDRCKVDIETPDNCAIVIRKASQISTPEVAKNTILFLVELAAMHRYDRITVFILLNLQHSEALPVYLAKIHCAISACQSKTAVIPIPPGNISAAIAKLVLQRKKPTNDRASLDDQATDLVATSNSLAIDRASFLLDLIPSLSVYQALQCLLLLDQLDVGGFAALFNEPLLRQQIILMISNRKDNGNGTINSSALTHLARLFQTQL